jgi:hypothetical protein
MTAIEQAEQLRLQAIEILTAERQRLDEQLAQLGYGQEKAPLGKKRGRKPKNSVMPQADQPSLAGMTGSALP